MSRRSCSTGISTADADETRRRARDHQQQDDPVALVVECGMVVARPRPSNARIIRMIRRDVEQRRQIPGQDEARRQPEIAGQQRSRIRPASVDDSSSRLRPMMKRKTRQSRYVLVAMSFSPAALCHFGAAVQSVYCRDRCCSMRWISAPPSCSPSAAPPGRAQRLDLFGVLVVAWAAGRGGRHRPRPADRRRAAGRDRRLALLRRRHRRRAGWASLPPPRSPI